MVPPSLSSTLTASCCRGEHYFQATSAILRLPRGPVEWEGRRRELREEAQPQGMLGNRVKYVCHVQLEQMRWEIEWNSNYQGDDNDG